MAERAGIAPERMLARAGLSERRELVLSSDLAKTDRAHWLPIENVFAVWDAAEEWLRGTDFLGELVRGLKPEHLGALGFRMLGAATLDESMEHLSSGFELVTNSGRWLQRRGREHVTYVWQRTATTAGQCLSNEAILGHVVSLLQNIGGAKVWPVQATLQHGAHWTQSTLSELLGTSVEYGAGENSLTFLLEALALPARQQSATMAPYFAKLLRERLELVAPLQSVTDLLQRELRSMRALSEESIVVASERLKVSPRTLQRRLKESGTSFTNELERVKRERALHLVRTTRRPLAEIASELGFADASTFSRAFRRWHGEQPSAVRLAAGR